MVGVGPSLSPSGPASERFGRTCPGYSRIGESKKLPTQNCSSFTNCALSNSYLFSILFVLFFKVRKFEWQSVRWLSHLLVCLGSGQRETELLLTLLDVIILEWLYEKICSYLLKVCIGYLETKGQKV